MADTLPLLLRAARGEQVERPPVWMMRQAGRYMKVYRDLRDRHPGFRERSENPDLSYEISMQPFHAFRPDGVILFSDILTPLPGMGIDFDIIESKGPIIEPAIRSQAQVDALRPLDPAEALPFVGEVLGRLRAEVGNQAAVLGFVGAPWTLAAYAVEGRSSIRSPPTCATRSMPAPRWCSCSIPGQVSSVRSITTPLQPPTRSG
jgi:uroporphyrinogen decarboxylase